MDSIDLLAREEEFKKLNKQLEKKTESLMKEIEQSMQKQDIFSEFSGSILNQSQKTKQHHCDSPSDIPVTPIPLKPKQLPKPTANNSDNNKNDKSPKAKLREESVSDCGSKTAKNSIDPRICCDCCVHPRNNNDLEFLYAFVSVNVKDKVLPQSFLKGRVSVESVCKFLSSKIKLMQEQIDKLQATINKKASQCENHLSQQAGLESERLTLTHRAANARAAAADARTKCAALQKRLDEKDRLYTEQRGEADRLASQVKRLAATAAAAEASRATRDETVDMLKTQLAASKLAEKEFRDATRNLSMSHQNAISRLEAQVKALTSHIDKQAALIDNLRKQNVLLSTDGAVKALERDYGDFLNQDL